VRKAFRQLARLYHPDVARDKPGAEDMFKRINQAYEVLRNPEKRRDYDRRGRVSAPPPRKPPPPDWLFGSAAQRKVRRKTDQARLTPDEVQRVVAFALNLGVGAVAEQQEAIVFVPMRNNGVEGTAYVHYHPQRIRTLNDAVSVLVLKQSG
jgi:curved DNA-binding protein CbpA